jgi:hypothetical protein
MQSNVKKGREINIQFCRDILVLSNFKHLQKSACMLALRHCLQDAPALHKSFWPKKENICIDNSKKLVL